MFSMFKRNLYSKMFTWLLLNLLLLGAIGLAFFIYILFGSSNGLLPSSIFSPNVENIYRIISADLQYRRTAEWPIILANYNKDNRIYHLASLDEPGLHYTMTIMPDKVLDVAAKMPRTPFTLCPDPTQVFSGEDLEAFESGLAPTPPAIFMLTGKPAHFWYGRVLFVPDESHQPHYLLLAVESPSFSGNGLFFNFSSVLWIILLVVGISCLWWWPFISHITRPLRCMVDYSERQAQGDPEKGKLEFACDIPDARVDEIGRLARAVTSMADKMAQLMLGQRQFIRHIAHELNSPLARCKLGLEVLEERLEGDPKQRIQRSMLELDNLSRLTDDVLTFLKAQSSPSPTKLEGLELYPLVMDLVRAQPDDADIQVLVPSELRVWGDKLHLRQAIGNVLANSVLYARGYGPIVIDAQEFPTPKRGGTEVLLSVRDSGPGVEPSEMELLQEPFFRGGSAQHKHPGGSGLGLSIVKNSMEKCEGTVSFANLSGGGFVVCMRFACVPCCIHNPAPPKD